MQNREARKITGVSYEDADHPSILYWHGWLSIRHLIALDLAVAMFKVARGIAPPPTPGGTIQPHLYGGVWPQDWKIDPSAD